MRNSSDDDDDDDDDDDGGGGGGSGNNNTFSNKNRLSRNLFIWFSFIFTIIQYYDNR